MSDGREFTNEELTAYLDGEAKESLMSEIEAALRSDKAVVERLDALRVDLDVLKSGGELLLSEAPELPGILSSATEAKPGLLKRYGAIAAVAVLCVALGMGLGRVLFAGPEESWQDFAAVYHALYVNKTLAHIDQTEGAARDELKRVSGAIGKPIALADLELDGLDYKRAQILGYKGRPLLQLAFLSKIGAPVAFCIFKSGNDAATAVKSARLRGLSASTWSRLMEPKLMIMRLE